jgi:hypothetical protein
MILKCVKPPIAGDRELWTRYLQEHGCIVVGKEDHDEVFLPEGTAEGTLPLTGVREPRYELTLPDGTKLIKIYLRREGDLVVLGIPKWAWNEFVKR